MIEVAVEPKTKADQEKLSSALAKLAAEDPSFRVGVDADPPQTVIKGIRSFPSSRSSSTG